MNAKKCDRCGVLYESSIPVPDIRINKYRHPYGDEWVDLCPECQTELEKWLGNTKFKTDIDDITSRCYNCAYCTKYSTADGAVIYVCRTETVSDGHPVPGTYYCIKYKKK